MMNKMSTSGTATGSTPAHASLCFLPWPQRPLPGLCSLGVRWVSCTPSPSGPAGVSKKGREVESVLNAVHRDGGQSLAPEGRRQHILLSSCSFRVSPFLSVAGSLLPQDDSDRQLFCKLTSISPHTQILTEQIEIHVFGTEPGTAGDSSKSGARLHRTSTKNREGDGMCWNNPTSLFFLLDYPFREPPHLGLCSVSCDRADLPTPTSLAEAGAGCSLAHTSSTEPAPPAPLGASPSEKAKYSTLDTQAGDGS